MIQGLTAQLKAREEAASSTERRLEAEGRALQQQRQDAELAGMKAQLAVQQQQQHSPMLSPLMQANPQLGGRSASRLQVCTIKVCSHLALTYSAKFMSASTDIQATEAGTLNPPILDICSDWRYT